MASNADVKLPPGVEIHGKSLRITFSHEGRRRRESLGLPPTKQNIKFAQTKREAIKYEMALGTFSYAKHFPDSPHATGKPNAQTMAELLDRYLATKKTDLRTSTYKKYVSMLNIIVDLYGKNRSCKTLAPHSVSELRSLIIQGRTSQTVNTYIRSMNSFLKWLNAMDYVDRDFSKYMPYMKVPERDINPFTMEEIALALKHCFQPQHKNIITLLVYSGLRSGELCGLAWEDIDFESRTMRIRRSTYEARGLKTTKTDKERTVDLLPPAYEALQEQKKLTWFNSPKEYPVELSDKSTRLDRIRFVFSPHVITGLNSIRPYDYLGKTSTNKMWKNICIRAGIPYRNVYQLRHTYASWMLSHANVNIAYLAEQMGHANFTMIATIYGKWMDNPNKRESDKAWEAMSKVVSAL
ncbi:site-specific integrase [Vibrio sp. ABG19]|uniref:site-specific integrase n=1 Tax=Vibrio sp. ABG19 TaxID=2817385 RepID=UPI00249F7B83|nr:site-specific integrase [Vibrio sp. ABG19]WGY45068.1 site-specific integrase [Vibrio sp. ABG19]